MANDSWIQTDEFQDECRFYETAIVGMAMNFWKTIGKPGKKFYVKKPTNIIIQSSELMYGKILMPPDCVPYDPANPPSPDSWNPVETDALLAKTSIPPILFPEAFGAIVKSEIDMYLVLREHAIVEKPVQGVYEWVSSEYDEEKEVLTPNDPFLRKAKNVVTDNAKTETMRLHDTGRNIPGVDPAVAAELFIGYNSTGFKTDALGDQYVPLDRCHESPNEWKDVHALGEQQLPFLLRAKPRYPTSFANTSTFIMTIPDPEDPHCIDTIDITVPIGQAKAYGSDVIKYVDSLGTSPLLIGSGINKDKGHDAEAHCRCYVDVAMILQEINQIVEKYKVTGGVCVPDVVHNTYNFEFWPIKRGDCEVIQAIDPKTVVSNEAIDVDILHFYKMTILVADVYINDDFDSHFFCGQSPIPSEPVVPEGTEHAVATPAFEEFHEIALPIPREPA